MMRRAVVLRPADVTITIPGRLRYWVAEALFDAVRLHAEVEEKQRQAGRRRRSNFRPPASVADGLRELASTIKD